MPRTYRALLAYLILPSCIVNYECHAQNWVGAQHFSGATGQTMRDLEVDSDGSVLIAGGFSDTLVIGTNMFPCNTTNISCSYVARLDSTGQLLWLELFENCNATALAIDQNGEIAVGGRLFNTVLTAGPDQLNPDSAGLFLVKLDASGNRLWGRNFGHQHAIGSNSMDMGEVTITPNNDILVACKISWNSDFEGQLLNIQDGPFTVSNWSSSGTLNWVEQYGPVGNSGVHQYDIETDGYGNAYFCGMSVDSNFFGPYSFDVPLGRGNAYLASINAQGQTNWVVDDGTSTPGPGGFILPTYVGTDVVADVYDNVYYTGFMMDSGMIGNMPVGDAQNPYLTKFFIAKYHNDGSFRWVRTADSDRLSSGEDIAVDHCGNVYALVMTDSTLVVDGQTVPNPPAVLERDLTVIKFDSLGNLQWHNHLDNNITWAKLGLSPDESTIYIAGSFEDTLDFGVSTLVAAQQETFFATLSNNAPTCPWIGQNVEEMAQPQALRVWPNPSSGSFFVDLTAMTADVVTIECFDELGRRVFTRKVAGGQRVELLDLDATSGVYFVRVLEHQYLVGTSLLLVK